MNVLATVMRSMALTPPCIYSIATQFPDSGTLSIFTAPQHSSMLSAVLAIVNPSVRLSVRHTLALCKNHSSYDYVVFTVG